MKSCKKCGIEKPYSEFYRAKGMRDGHRSECISCHRAGQRRWYQANRRAAIAGVKRWQVENKERLRAYRREYRKRRKLEDRDAHLRRTFGITLDDYDRMLAAQGGGCAICGRPPRQAALHVDHDHATGVVRGLLCVGCNNALGQFRDDLALLCRAGEYVSGGVMTLTEVHELGQRARVRAGELRRSPV